MWSNPAGGLSHLAEFHSSDPDPQDAGPGADSAGGR